MATLVQENTARIGESVTGIASNTAAVRQSTGELAELRTAMTDVAALAAPMGDVSRLRPALE